MTEEISESSVGSSPVADVKAKRKVSYNQEAVLCPICTKRIRLNNNGSLRVHVLKRAGSARCAGSMTMPIGAPIILASPELFKREAVESSLFSDVVGQ